MYLANAHYRDLPGWQQKNDYDVRTDGQPVYIGRALNTASDDDNDWVISKVTYTAEGWFSAATCKVGAWSARASLFA